MQTAPEVVSESFCFAFKMFIGSFALKVLMWIASFVFRHISGRSNALPFEVTPQISYQPTPYGPQSLEEANLAMEALYGNPLGDMRFNTPDIPLGGVGIKDTKYRWPGYPGKPVVAYKIDSSVSGLKSLIKKAIDQYHKHTCVKFVERKNEKDYVEILKADGCWSHIGKQGGKQHLSLGKGCNYEGTIVHELGHAIGLYHEQQRTDRDNYISVNMTNVKKGFENNFEKVKPSDELRYTPYDYNSIMHYGEYAFSRAPKILKTMVAKDGKTVLKEPYEKPGLTTRDMDVVNKMYQCKK